MSELTTVIERGGGLVTALDVTASGADRSSLAVASNADSSRSRITRSIPVAAI